MMTKSHQIKRLIILITILLAIGATINEYLVRKKRKELAERADLFATKINNVMKKLEIEEPTVKENPFRILNYNEEWEEPFIYFKDLSENQSYKEYTFGKFGKLYVIYDKEDTKVIKNLDSHWITLEEKLSKHLENLIHRYERVGHLKVKYFQAFANTNEYDENVFHGTDSDVRLSFCLLEVPTWDYWIKGDKIIHGQAAF